MNGHLLVDAETGLKHTEIVSDAERDPTIRKVADRLATRFPAAPRHRIEGIVAEEYDSLETGRIRIYIPTLIENSARTRLHRELNN
ncbi:type IV pilus biogenesis protein CpaD/CtpE [Pseudarthrobacter sp. PvP090]